MKAPVLLFACAACVLLTGGASKPSSAVPVRFHGQGGGEGEQFASSIQLLGSKRPVHMQTMPLITEREIISYHPFEAPDGSGTFGAYFRLDKHGTNLLSQHTFSRRGTYLFAAVNGRRVVDLIIDRPVADGILTIPSGLTAEDMEMLKASFPPFGMEGTKPSGKRPKPSPKPSPSPSSEASGT